MTSALQITSRHRDRLAVIYVRQSNAGAGAREHRVHTNRQYGLAEKAISLGWDGSHVLVIDGDLGLSGRSSSLRPGFKELVSRVCLGEVGAIFGLEVSRLARSSADFQRLLEFCSLTDTLIVDADGGVRLQIDAERRPQVRLAKVSASLEVDQRIAGGVELRKRCGR